MTLSRTGKKPVLIPQNVKVNLNGDILTVVGPLGTLKRQIKDVILKIEDNRIIVNQGKSKALHGLMRSLINNMVIGVKKGYSKSLSIEGIGYKAERKNNKIIFYLGFAHPVEFQIPEGIDIKVDEKGTKISVNGISKELVGETSATIRRIKPPDAYKGKGIRYSGEVLKLKVGKKTTK